jgi:hypothetical protein
MKVLARKAGFFSDSSSASGRTWLHERAPPYRTKVDPLETSCCMVQGPSEVPSPPVPLSSASGASSQDEGLDPPYHPRRGVRLRDPRSPAPLVSPCPCLILKWFGVGRPGL